MSGKSGTAVCRQCGKSIEADARFCRFCGKAQAGPVSGSTPTGTAGSSSRPAGRTGSSLEERLQQVFPRHHLQDEFQHIGSIAAFLMALIGLVVGFFYNYSWLGANFLLGSIALLLFLRLRESTLSHMRGGTAGSGPYSAARRPMGATEGPAEAANADSSPPKAGRGNPK